MDLDSELSEATVIHVGFSGTRHGTTTAQLVKVINVLAMVTHGETAYAAHHGACFGADAEFHAVCMSTSRSRVSLHPCDIPAMRAECCGAFEIMDEMPPLKRNRAIVNASQIMIAAPYENEPQRRGGTQSTIRLAQRMLNFHLRALYVVGREGQLLDHTRWT